MTNNNSAAIEVVDLVTHYGPREILHGINLTINEGEIMIIMGGSGSGDMGEMFKTMARRHARHALDLRADEFLN